MKYKFSLLILLLFYAFNIKAQSEIRFTYLKATSNTESKAIEVVNSSLTARGYVPKEFFVKVTEDEELYVFILIHQDTYLPANNLVVGNPSGKAHECRYHKFNHEIISCLYYQ